MASSPKNDHIWFTHQLQTRMTHCLLWNTKDDVSKKVQAVALFQSTKVVYTTIWSPCGKTFWSFFPSYQTFKWKIFPTVRGNAFRASLAMSSSLWQPCAGYLHNVKNVKWFMTCHMLITKGPSLEHVQWPAFSWIHPPNDRSATWRNHMDC